MKLFVWHIAATWIFALAETEEQARQMIAKDKDSWAREISEKKPEVVNTPRYYYLDEYDE
jgi:hypothetical protein